MNILKNQKDNMKKRSLAVLCFMLLVSCRSNPETVPEGTWKYDLYVNGVKAGSAITVIEEKENLYITKNEMYLKMGTMENKTVQTVTETKDFKPVSLEILNTMKDTSAGLNQEIKKTAVFEGSTVTLVSDGYKSEIKLEEPFILDGNFFFKELVKSGFKKGTRIEAQIYEPSVSIDNTILVIVDVAGREKIQIGSEEMNLIHVKQRVEQLKIVDMYLNDEGVMEKAVIKMLNNVFELIRVQ
jgi:hypothetical protein